MYRCVGWFGLLGPSIPCASHATRHSRIVGPNIVVIYLLEFHNTTSDGWSLLVKKEKQKLLANKHSKPSHVQHGIHVAEVIRRQKLVRMLIRAPSPRRRGRAHFPPMHRFWASTYICCAWPSWFLFARSCRCSVTHPDSSQRCIPILHGTKLDAMSLAFHSESASMAVRSLLIVP